MVESEPGTFQATCREHIPQQRQMRDEKHHTRHGRPIIGGAVAVAIAIFLWILLSSIIRPVRFPSPEQVVAAGWQVATTGYAGGTLLMHTLYSMKLALMGFAVAVAAAIPLGIAMGISRHLNAIFSPIVSFIRPIPPLAWIPVAIIWFGLGDGAKIFVIWFTAFVPTLINTHTGVRNVDPILIAAARVHGASGYRLIFEVIVPGAMPLIFGGLRISLQASWMALVAAELVGAFFGLGRVLMIAAQDIYPGMIVVAMGCVAAAGALMTKGLIVLERLAMPWIRPIQ
jgi:NitT/TauT family transport system permease protein/taurine transport system permease protein